MVGNENLKVWRHPGGEIVEEPEHPLDSNAIVVLKTFHVRRWSDIAGVEGLRWLINY
jgi:hypothetical protein